jgi:hypothetical protein
MPGKHRKFKRDKGKSTTPKPTSLPQTYRQSSEPIVDIDEFSVITGIPDGLITEVRCVMWASHYSPVYFVALRGAQPQEVASLHDSDPLPPPPRPLMWSGYVTVHTPMIDMSYPWPIVVEGSSMHVFLQLLRVTPANILGRLQETPFINALYDPVQERYTLSLTPQKKDQGK